jgi:CelD/BcsL family acetyltransferase involved in cellulose biosynthesis
VRVTVLKEISEDPDLRAAWNSLVLLMENSEVFFTYEWALAVSRGFQKNLSPLLFLMYDSDQLAGVAALAVDPHAPRSAFFLTSSTADYCDILSAPENRRAVLLALLEEIQNLGFRDLVLANLPSNSATLAELPCAAGSSGFYITSRAAFDCGIVQLGDDEHRKTLVQTIAGKSREKRALKKLAALGPVRVFHVTEPEQIRTTLETIASAQISRFLAGGRLSPLLDPERRAFLSQLSDLLAHAGWLKISQMEVNAQPIAWNYGFRFAASWFWYLPAFQLEYESASPGSCLLRLLVEEACKDPSLRWLDLGLGDESYKARFANHVRQTRYVQLSRRLPKHLAKVGRQALGAAAARFPSLGNKLRRAMASYRSLAGRIQETGLMATGQHSVHRVTRSFASRDELLLFEAPQIETSEILPNRLLPLTWEHLAQASITNSDDPQTLSYLIRCAQRMTQPPASGFLLQHELGRSSHFLWILSYDGFHLSEIDHRLEPFSPAAAMIFDCWTPAADRGRGYYATAIRSAATTLQSEGRSAWIFTDASNVSSLRGILKAGFEYRFSLVRRRRFGHSIIVRHDTTSAL